MVCVHVRVHTIPGTLSFVCFVGRADCGVFVRFENTAGCLNARRTGSHQLRLLPCVFALWSGRTCFWLLCAGLMGCAVLCYDVLAVDARRQHARRYKKKAPQKQK